ncbi:hypothetical protein BV25DRAFT_1821235 [Artomyces pyxidatus]|uniref:Uncharacterized protein n=1 Tax=Artomyces pyxidatus TaxID=48021 RepID=A0ACB8TBX9_9AGAM|nr:hypothetical protein BV25DRAFT_1821235 [Artomyces pyxidatus]
MSLSKIPLLLVSNVLVWKAFTPPPQSHSPPTEKVQLQRGGIEQFVGRFTMSHAFIYKIQFCVGCICEIVWIIACNSSHNSVTRPFLSTFTAHGGEPSSPVRITPHFAIGSALIVAGAGVRLICYRVMGKQFTFDLLLRDKHQLITAGPYSYVRHPSYTGLLCLFAGCALVLFGNGSWFRETGWFDAPIGVVCFSVWVLMRVVESVYIFVRTVSEDRFLKEKFGDEWVTWAVKTRYRIFPFVF